MDSRVLSEMHFCKKIFTAALCVLVLLPDLGCARNLWKRALHLKMTEKYDDYEYPLHSHSSHYQKNDRCPPPPQTLPDRACEVPSCRSDSECERHKRCCYNGCIYACLESVQPPPVLDWLVQPKPRWLGGNGWLLDGPEEVLQGRLGGVISEIKTISHGMRITAEVLEIKILANERVQCPCIVCTFNGHKHCLCELDHLLCQASLEMLTPWWPCMGSSLRSCLEGDAEEAEACSTTEDGDEPLHCPTGYECHIINPGNTAEGIPNRGQCIKLRGNPDGRNLRHKYYKEYFGSNSNNVVGYVKNQQKHLG